MILRRVERGEVVEVVFDLRAVGDGEAERMKELSRRVPCTRDSGCSVPAPRPRPGSVTSSASAASCRGELRIRERGAARGQRALRARALASLIAAPAAGRSAAGSLPSPFSNVGQRAGLAEIASPWHSPSAAGSRALPRISPCGLGDDAGCKLIHSRHALSCATRMKRCEASNKKVEAVAPPRCSADSIRPERLWPAPRSS